MAKSEYGGQFRRLFWIMLAFAVPTVLLSPMFASILGYALPHDGWVTWVAPVLGTVIYVWGGRPFLTGTMSEVKARKPGTRASYRKMKQNLWWVAGYNLIAVPLAAGVLAPIGFVMPMAGNDNPIWPHCDGLIWPHPRTCSAGAEGAERTPR